MGAEDLSHLHMIKAFIYESASEEDFFTFLKSRSDFSPQATADGYDFLSIAIEFRFSKMLDFLLQHKDVNLDIVACTPEYDGKCLTPLLYAVQLNNQEYFERLLAAGANLHATDVNGDDALDIAAAAGHFSFAKLLMLDHGFQPDLRTQALLSTSLGMLQTLELCR